MSISSAQAAGGGDVRGDEMTVLVDGERWTGWQELSVVRMLDSAAGRFTVKVPPTLGSTWPLRPGSVVELGLGADDTLLTGSVDAVTASLEKGGRTITVSGRDKAATLVDCTVDLDVYEWRNATLRQIIEDLIDPFGVKLGVVTSPATERFDIFACSSTEKVWAVIERGLRLKGLLGYSLPNGKLALERAGGPSPEVDLVEGENVISARFRWDVANRFSAYRVEGQRSGSDDGWGDEIISLAGEARDLEIEAHRPLTLRGEQGMTSEDCLVRAQWEATVRRARSNALEILVHGWRQGSSVDELPPWQVNATPFVSLPSLGLSGTWLISRVRFTRSAKAGPRTALELVPVDSFNPTPTVDLSSSVNGFMISDEGNSL